MNLRNVDSYSIGLDVGTGSVGWAVIDENGDLCRFKGKPTWGSRIFTSAQTAAETRVHRGQRRRYDRRRQRLELLQGFFARDMEQVDPEFFIRLNQSRLWPADRDPSHADYRWPLFNDDDFDERAYYKDFPTIYHVRAWLMEAEEKADLRLIYLAFHNIVKHRGNFLHQDNPSLSARNANTKEAVGRLCRELEEWCQSFGIDCSCDVQAVVSSLEDDSMRPAQRQEAVQKAIDIDAEYAKMAKEVSKAVVGYSTDFSSIFFSEFEDGKFSLSSDEKVDAFICPDEAAGLFEALRAVYSSFVLLGILGGAQGRTLSFCKVQDFERYGEELKLLKDLVRRYAPECYDRFFRGVQYAESNDYDVTKAEGYTRYNLGTSKLSHENFLKEVKRLLDSSGATEDALYRSIKGAMDEGTFLRRLKTSDNGVIPYQLHLEEMQAIIDSQATYYPFLREEQAKIESLVTFRIPYYVGPLTQKNAACVGDKLRFAWSERRPEKEQAKIYPWNWEEVIDKDASAEAFIRRMTGTCTYVRGEPVLPRHSLMYELFCVLNELNGAKCSQGGDKGYRFDAYERKSIVEELFKRRKTGVTYQALEDWLGRVRGPEGGMSVGGAYHVTGGQGEERFESKLSSYCDFCKILGKEELSDADISMAEDVVLWNTVFEDRSILKRKIKAAYGGRLSDDQIGKICRKRYSGWGRLSRKFLNGIRVEVNGSFMSIMDILAEGNPRHGDRTGRATNLMEILHDEQLGFARRIDEINAACETNEADLIDEMAGSPALRRGVRQSLRVVDEIASIAGKPPTRIFLEVTRDEDKRNKGKRTNRRYKSIQGALSNLKSEYADVLHEMKGCDPRDFDDKRLVLYFTQCGKSLYSGKPLDINRLSEYQIDHIIPQSYLKDDSFENLALVRPEENQRKQDTLLIDRSIVQKMKGFWSVLRDAGLIGAKKYANLMRDSFSEDQMKGFINRQLVETSQVVKQVQQVLRVRYAGSEVWPVKASMSHQLRDECKLAKCREINDFHHAHDAYLACQIGRFIQKRHGDVFEDPMKMTRIVKTFIRHQAEDFYRTRDLPGSAGFVVSSFLSSGFNAETGEIFKDDWSAEEAVDRIKRCLDYKDCFISRMPEETRGAFWDQNPVSPKAKENVRLPLKRDLDPRKYGCYDNEKFAYFFIYEAENLKNGKTVLEFAPVPVHVASSSVGNAGALEDYAKKLADVKGLEFHGIRKRKIGKYQQIELNGDRLYITGIKVVRNGRQFAFSQEETELMCRVRDGGYCSDEEIKGLFHSFLIKFDRFAPRLGSQLKIADRKQEFESADLDDRRRILLLLASAAAAHVDMIDLKAIGGPKAAGNMQPTFSKELSDPRAAFYFVDVSVTGMFERRYRIGL
ncbi:MAG: type II CRISPR RNA-guided endonuclease Cas9 [Gordonibacter sp.]